MKKFILNFLLVLCAGTALTYGQQQAKRPNIVIYVADDLGAWDIGSYGNKSVKTPNLDRLAGESMQFNQAFAAATTCVPARSALFTGLYPHRNGAHVNRMAVREQVKSITHYFKDAGYRIAIAGKLHIGAPENFPFEYIPGTNRREPGTEGKSGMFTDLYLPPVDEWLAGYDGDKPFVLIIADHSTHVTWPQNPAYTPDQIAIHPFHVDTRDTRRMLTRYYTDITKLDDNVGNAENILKKHKLQDNTIMLFTADQGPQLPFGKWTVYDYGVQVPLLIRWLGKVRQGSRTEALVSHVDIIPTLLEAVGAKAPADIDGKSFLEVLKDPGQSHHEAVFANHNGDKSHDQSPMRMLRTGRYKYIANIELGKPVSKGKQPRASWVKLAETDAHAKMIVDRMNQHPAEELYDLQNDHYELKNLAGLPEYQALLKDFRKQMETFRTQQGDVGDNWKEDLKRLPDSPGPNPLVPYTF